MDLYQSVLKDRRVSALCSCRGAGCYWDREFLEGYCFPIELVRVCHIWKLCLQPNGLMRCSIPVRSVQYDEEEELAAEEREAEYNRTRYSVSDCKQLTREKIHLERYWGDEDPHGYDCCAKLEAQARACGVMERLTQPLTNRKVPDLDEDRPCDPLCQYVIDTVHLTCADADDWEVERKRQAALVESVGCSAPGDSAIAMMQGIKALHQQKELRQVRVQTVGSCSHICARVHLRACVSVCVQCGCLRTCLRACLRVRFSACQHASLLARGGDFP